ncbi:MAG TPA: ATP-binding protein [Candidatus Elarobacter sp.]|nr:ATP-binding protein [Candidatus Elarobacter sp.]
MPNTTEARPAPPKVDNEATFRKALTGTGSATTEVSTDPRVFERITLGLYREPSAAIRELISNAYDADATEVKIRMNPPVFNEVVVEDNGIGMSPAAIDQIVHHVGGSLKRSTQGRDAGVTASAGTSPKGRKLIGQMGIGLYSVARLTRRFSVETKQADSPYRILLDIDLTGLDPANLPEEGAERYVAGYAKVSRERAHPAESKKSYTRITLHDILPEARRILQSVDRWDNFYAKAVHRNKGELKYHIGRLAPKMEPNLPWGKSQKPSEKFLSFVNSLSTPDESAASSASLDQTLDYYLAMLWRISLSAPLRYVEDHPFSLTSEADVDFYSLKSDGTPERIDLKPGETIGQRVGISEQGSSPTPFKVLVDDIELRRPIIFRGFTPDARKLLHRPKMFVGAFESEADGAKLRGTGYFFWSYDIAPKENNGILVRIAGASGTLFDRGFLDFRTSENLRLRQVSSEAFVERGLENALNVDRESFVDSDPNYRALQRWAHRSMTRLFTRLKMDQKQLGADRKAFEETERARKAEDTAKKIWATRRGTPRSKPPGVLVTSKSEAPRDTRSDTIFIGGISSEKRGGVEKEEVFSARLRSVVLVLDAWGLLDELTDGDRSALVADLARVLDRR